MSDWSLAALHPSVKFHQMLLIICCDMLQSVSSNGEEEKKQDFCPGLLRRQLISFGKESTLNNKNLTTSSLRPRPTPP